MMKQVSSIKSIAAALLLGSTTGYADVNMHEGLWETVTTSEMTGMPMPVSIPPVTFRECLTKKMFIPQSKKEQENCKITKQEVEGDTLKWEMVCTGEDAMRAKGEIIYRGDTMEGTTVVEMKSPQMGTMKVVNHIKGRYIGECKK